MRQFHEIKVEDGKKPEEYKREVHMTLSVISSLLQKHAGQHVLVYDRFRNRKRTMFGVMDSHPCNGRYLLVTKCYDISGMSYIKSVYTIDPRKVMTGETVPIWVDDLGGVSSGYYRTE